MSDLYYSGGDGTTKLYNLPLSCFEPTFIESCSEVKQLEKILKVLRSGSEGSFGHLEQAAEKRIQDLDPNNRILRQDAQIPTAADLSSDKRQALQNYLNHFLNDIKMLDDDLKRKDATNYKSQQPPVRPFVKSQQPPVRPFVKSQQPPVRPFVKSGKQKNDVNKSSAKPREYKEWDKLNFDAMEQAASVENVTMSKTNDNAEIEEDVPTCATSQRELQRLADMNKDKGNEYFTAGDYDKAIKHYSRSISAVPSAASYNNRALAYLKQGNHASVISDCQHVLSVEADNVKALLRRGSAYQAQLEYGKAKRDFQLVLEMEPQNVRARKLLNETMSAWKTKGKKLVISEVDGSDDDQNVAPPDVAPPDVAPPDVAPPDVAPPDVAPPDVAPQDIAPPDVAPQDIAPPDIAPPDIAPPDIAPPDIAPPDIAPPDIAPPDIAPSPAHKLITPVNDSWCHAKIEPSNMAESTAKSRRLVIAETDESEEETVSDTDLRDQSENYSTAYDANEVSSSANIRAVSTDFSTDSGQMDILHGASTSLTDSTLFCANSADADCSLTPELSRLSVDGGIPESAAVREPARPRFIQSELPDDLFCIKESGNQAFRAGQYGIASGFYSRIITKINTCAQSKSHQIVNLSVLYNNRAMCQIKLGDCKAAIEDCNQSLALIPHSVKPLLRRAQAFETMEKYKEAYRDFQHAFCLQADLNLAQQGLGRCGNMLRALYGKAWRSEVEHVFVNQWDAPHIINASEIATHLTDSSLNEFPLTQNQADLAGNPQRPVVSSNLALNIGSAPSCVDAEYPGSAPRCVNAEYPGSAPSCVDAEIEHERLKALGNQYVGKCEYQTAIDHYTRCLLLFQDRSAVYANRALCYLRLHRIDDVIGDCNQAIQLDQGNVKAWFRRALAKKYRKDYRGSMEDLLQVLRLDGGNTSAKRELESVKAAYKESFAKEKNAAAETRAKALIEVLSEENGDLKAKTAQSSRSASTKTEQSSRSASTKTDQSSRSASSKNDHQSKGTPHKGYRATSERRPAGSSNPTIKLNKTSPFEFMQAWHSLKGSKSMTPYAQLLDQIEPSQLSMLLGNKLDSEMLTTMLRTIQECTLTKSISRAYQMLNHLRHVERFDMANMFMTSTDKLIVREILEKISRDNKNLCTKTDLTSLRKAFKV